jgi:hypothetical protein
MKHILYTKVVLYHSTGTIDLQHSKSLLCPKILLKYEVNYDYNVLPVLLKYSTCLLDGSHFT